jgi:hypothetical protein
MPPIRPLRALTLGLVLLLAVPGVAAAQELQPLMHGWEHYFSVTWDTVQRRGRVEVEGYVVNRSPYRINRVRVLVDSLDDANRIVDQKVGWVPGELPGDSRLYFNVPVTPAGQYRVRVFSYDRIESAQVLSP